MVLGRLVAWREVVGGEIRAKREKGKKGKEGFTAAFGDGEVGNKKPGDKATGGMGGRESVWSVAGAGCSRRAQREKRRGTLFRGPDWVAPTSQAKAQRRPAAMLTHPDKHFWLWRPAAPLGQATKQMRKPVRVGRFPSFVANIATADYTHEGRLPVALV